MTNIVITTFYHFITLSQLEQCKEWLLVFCNQQQLKGTILIASEGINSTISGSRHAIDALYQKLEDKLGIDNLNYKESYAEQQAFLKMKVRIKKEVVSLGAENLDVARLKGAYVSSKDWDTFTASDDVMVIDTRNKYEILLGGFAKAINPETDNFREFPIWVKNNLNNVSKEQKIAMYCTGGIRCEKSTAYLKSLGFENVYHLEGGILQYFEDLPVERKTSNNNWHGSCFVFDDRVALNTELSAEHKINCTKCEQNMSTDDVRHAALVEKMICLKCHI